MNLCVTLFWEISEFAEFYDQDEPTQYHDGTDVSRIYSDLMRAHRSM